jgi:hypothetical protein
VVNRQQPLIAYSTEHEVAVYSPVYGNVLYRLALEEEPA